MNRPGPTRRTSGRVSRPGVVAWLVAWAAACAPVEVPFVVPGSGTPDTAEPVGPPELEVEPTALDFGDVLVEETLSRDIHFRNAGGGTLLLERVWLEHEEPVFELSVTGCMLLGPGEETTAEVRFSPLHAGATEALLGVEARGLEPVMTSVGGTGLAPGALVTPGELELTAVPVGCIAVEDVEVQNVGNLPLVVEAVALETSSEEISLEVATEANGPLPWEVRPGDALVVASVRYGPSDAEDDVGRIEVRTSDPQVPSSWLGVAASPAEAELVEEFFPTTGKQQDLVIFVDHSDPMWWHVEQFAAHAVAFTHALDDAGIDWRLAVVVEEDGCVLGSTPWVSSGSTEQEIRDILAAMLGTSSGPSWGVDGLARLDAALDESGVGGCNEDLIREAAALHLVGISNHADISLAPPDHYLERFRAMERDPAQVVVHAIGGNVPVACPGVAPYHGFWEAARDTSGAFVSICSNDWSLNLEKLTSALVAGPTGTARAEWFHLSQPPVNGTIQVLVDGVTLWSGWTWVAERGAIHIDPIVGLPATGTVTVRYTVQADCGEERDGG